MLPIKEYEDLYSITRDSRVWSHPKKYGWGNPLRKGMWLKLILQNTGYYAVILWKKGKSKLYLIHRLIATHLYLIQKTSLALTILMVLRRTTELRI